MGLSQSLLRKRSFIKKHNTHQKPNNDFEIIKINTIDNEKINKIINENIQFTLMFANLTNEINSLKILVNTLNEKINIREQKIDEYKTLVNEYKADLDKIINENIILVS